MKLDFSTLEADVAAWREGYIQHVEETFGEDAAIATERDFTANPWMPLKWYLEDMSAAIAA